eukprot:gene8394-8578_t
MDAIVAQLPQIEAMCEILYTAQTTEQRTHAENALRPFGQSTEYIVHCKALLDNSKSPYAQILASSSLLKLVTEHALRHGPTIDPFACTSVVQLLCRTVKLAWFDSDAAKAIVDDCKALMERGSPGHYLLGLKILSMLVLEMNQATPGRTLTAGLQLALSCLSFDFVGTCLDDSAEDVSTIQVPSSWRSLVEDPATLQLFLDYYAATRPPPSKLALECLVRLASVRRSLFSSDVERSKFLNRLVNGCRDILTSGTGLLNHHDNYHEFCKLLGRLKTNYQLSELVSVDNYTEWIQLVAQLTIHSLKSWEFARESVYYLLGLWSRLVSSMPYLKGDSPSLLEANVPQITQAYITSRENSRQRLDMAVLAFFQNFRKVYIGEQSTGLSVALGNRWQGRSGVQKVATNLKVYGSSEQLVHLTLGLFQDLATGYMSGKLLLKLEAVHFMLTNHTSSYYSFLDHPVNGRNRTCYYNTLARLLFMEDVPSRFKTFMVPLANVSKVLVTYGQQVLGPNHQVGDLYNDKYKGIWICLQGGPSSAPPSCLSSAWETGMVLLYGDPALKDALAVALRMVLSMPLTDIMSYKKVAKAYFSLLEVLCHNHTGTVACQDSSTFSFVLTSLDQGFGWSRDRGLPGHVTGFGWSRDRGLAGHVTGVWSLTLLQHLKAKINWHRLLRYVRGLVVLGYEGLRVTCATLLTEGLKSLDVSISSACASAVDNLATFYFRNVVREPESGKPAAGAAEMQEHLRQAPGLLPEILKSLFEIILFEENSNQWSLSRPMLSLILVYLQLRQQIIMAQPLDKQAHLATCLDKLMTDVNNNLEPKNRDKFTQNLTIVRHEYRSKS